MSPRIMLSAFLLLLAGPAMAQSKAAIEKLNTAWMAAFNKGDAAAVAAMYTDDAYVLPPGADLVQGRSAIQSFWSQAAQQLGDAKLTTINVLPLGRNAAREVGTVSATTKAQPPQQIVGKYVVVWQKVGDKWLLATDIWNMNK